MLFDGILAREARIDEQLGEVLRIDLRSRSNLQRRAQQTLGPADARQQRRRGGDDQPRGAGRGAMQRTRTRRRHAEVRRHAAIGIHLQRRQRKDGAFDVRTRCAFERCVEEARVRRHLVDVFVRRDDEQRDSRGGTRRHRRRECLCRGGQARNDMRRPVE